MNAGLLLSWRFWRWVGLILTVVGVGVTVYRFAVEK